MHLEVSKQNLAHLLYLTNTIVERRNTMPILANAKLTARDSSLQIAATDLEVSLVGETDAEIKEEGSITVSAKFLYDIVRELPEGTVTLRSMKGERLEVETGNSHFKVNGIAADEFPSIMGITLENPVSVEAAKLVEMLDKTSYAVSVDETRYNINGVYVETNEEKMLRFVATDGHRLAMIDRVADGLTLSAGVIVPRKGIQELRKVLEGNDGAARISVSDGFFTVESGRVTLGIRLIDGEFPNYNQVIPKELSTTVRTNKVDFQAMLKRVSLVTTDKSRSIRLRVSDNSLMVSSSSPEYGEAVESLPCDQDGEEVSIGFSARYIIDILSAMPSSEEVIIRLNGSLNPGVFQGDADDDYTCVVMPMRFD